MSDDLALKPLAFDDVVRVLDALGRAEFVLVGGQAVAIWAYHYASAGRVPELTDEREMFVSKDVDALTSAEELRERMVELAHHLDGESQVDAISPRGGQELGPPLPNSTVVRFVDSGGIPREVDVLDRLFGVDADKVLSTAVEMAAPGGERAYYQHPLSLVESRIANCVELEKYRTPRGMRQAEVSILVLREFLIDVAHRKARDARRLLQDLENVCRSSRGVRAFAELGLDPSAAAAACTGYLGESFLASDWPRRVRRVVSARDAWKARHTCLSAESSRRPGHRWRFRG